MKHVLVGSAPSPVTLPAVKVARRAHLKSICGRAAAPVSAGPLVEPYKVSLVQLGCPKNTTDAEVLLGDLVKSGFQVTEELESSDAVIVNTCAFVEAAKAESLEVCSNFDMSTPQDGCARVADIGPAIGLHAVANTSHACNRPSWGQQH